MNKNTTVTLTVLLIVLIGCSSKNRDEISLSGTKISIKYSAIDSATVEDYIVINNIKFDHSNKFDDWDGTNIFSSEDDPNLMQAYLPASKSYRTNASFGDRTFMERINGFMMARVLSHKLRASGFNIIDPRMLSIKGELIFESGDSNPIEVRSSSEYPAIIRIIE